jgi:Armadillo/beta-catenin-like repeat
VLIDLGVLPRLLDCIDRENNSEELRKEACGILSNIMGGTVEQIQSIFDTGIFPRIVELMRASPFPICKEATRGIRNVMEAGSELLT